MSEPNAMSKPDAVDQSLQDRLREVLQEAGIHQVLDGSPEEITEKIIGVVEEFLVEKVVDALIVDPHFVSAREHIETLIAPVFEESIPPEMLKALPALPDGLPKEKLDKVTFGEVIKVFDIKPSDLVRGLVKDFMLKHTGFRDAVRAGIRQHTTMNDDVRSAISDTRARVDDWAVRLATVENDPKICTSARVETLELFKIAVMHRYGWTESQFSDVFPEKIREILDLMD